MLTRHTCLPDMLTQHVSLVEQGQRSSHQHRAQRSARHHSQRCAKTSMPGRLRRPCPPSPRKLAKLAGHGSGARTSAGTPPRGCTNFCPSTRSPSFAPAAQNISRHAAQGAHQLLSQHQVTIFCPCCPEHQSARRPGGAPTSVQAREKKKCFDESRVKG